jgi:hypothetical protein
MELYHYVLATGTLTTSTATGKRLLEHFTSIYGAAMSPSEILASGSEQQKFCDGIREAWKINAPNEVIIQALKDAAGR